MSSSENALLELDQRLLTCSLENTPEFSLFGKSKCKVLDVIDGDTFKAAMMLNGVAYIFTYRVYGINAPELKPRLSVMDRLCVKRRARAAKAALTEIIMDKICDLVMHGRDSFGRVLSEVYVDGTDVGKMLIDRGFAVVFYPNKIKEIIKSPTIAQIDEKQDLIL